MIFDSWAGMLAPDDLPASSRSPPCSGWWRAEGALGLPLIYFPNQGATLLDAAREAGVDVMASTGAPRSPRRAPSWDRSWPYRVILTRRPCSRRGPSWPSDRPGPGGGRAPEPGHIFNLGHGIERTTDPDALAFLVDYVHEQTPESSGR
jgi:uroporphyrinogen decarboxylase